MSTIKIRVGKVVDPNLVTGQSSLKQTLLFVAFEHTRLNLHKIRRNQERDHRVGLRIDGDIECHDFDVQEGRVHN